MNLSARKKARSISVVVPLKVSGYDPDRDAYVDIRTRKLIPKDEAGDYIEFTQWYELTVQAMIEAGSNHLHASAYLAQSLLEHYLEAMPTQ